MRQAVCSKFSCAAGEPRQQGSSRASMLGENPPRRSNGRSEEMTSRRRADEHPFCPQELSRPIPARRARPLARPGRQCGGDRFGHRPGDAQRETAEISTAARRRGRHPPLCAGVRCGMPARRARFRGRNVAGCGGDSGRASWSRIRGGGKPAALRTMFPDAEAFLPIANSSTALMGATSISIRSSRP